MTTVVDYPLSPLSAARVAAQSSGKHAWEMRVASHSFRSTDIGSAAINPRPDSQGQFAREMPCISSRKIRSTDLGSTAIKCHFGFSKFLLKNSPFKSINFTLSANQGFRLTLL